MKRGKHFAGYLAITKTFGTMKKIFILLGCMMLPFLVSCEREYIQQDALYSVEYDLRPGDWTLVDQGVKKYYTVALDVREITRQVCENGSVQCFLMYDGGSQICLPTTRYNDGEADNGDTVFYQELIDFEYSVGTVNLFYTTSDFIYGGYPEKMRVRVVVHY